MILVTSIILGIRFRDLNGRDHSIKLAVIHHEAPFIIFLCLRTGKIGFSDGEAVRIISINSLLSSYIISFNT